MYLSQHLLWYCMLAAKGSSLGNKAVIPNILSAFPYLLRNVCIHTYVSMTSFVRGDKKHILIFFFFLILSSGSRHHINRSLSKSLPLDNRVILLGADVVFTDSCSRDSDGFFIVVVDMMEKKMKMIP